MKPLIGITSNMITHEDWAPRQYGQNTTYVEAIERAGGVPLILPQLVDEANLRQLYQRLDGLVLAGGEDIAMPHSLRDRNEFQLAKWAVGDHKPLLGLCRGMQVVNQALGGELFDDIPSQVPGALDHNASRAAQDIAHVAHRIRIKPRSRLALCLGVEQAEINEYHHQAVSRLGRGLQAVAWTDDGIVEAVEGDGEAYVRGVQCHPESLLDQGTPWLKLFAELVTRAAALSYSK